MNEDLKRKSRTMDDVMADIEAISEDSEHRDQFKALKMLASAKSSSVTLPPPMEEHEMIERFARLMKPAGFHVVQIAYKRAFPNRKPIEEVEPKLNAIHLPDEDRLMIQKCTNLKALYRMFPEIKKPGLPTGYPKGRGKVLQQQYCRDQATKILLDRQQARMKAVESRDVGLENAEGVQGVPEATLSD